MPLSAVRQVTLNKDDTITLAVEVYNFEEDSLIEISGQASQANGAVATFYSVQPMPADNGEEATLIVETAVPPNKFVAGFPITVVARAAEVWITTLEAEMEPGNLPRLGSHPDSAPPTAGWKKNNSFPALYLPTQPSQQAQESQSPETSSPRTLTWHGTWWDRRKGDRLDVVMEGRFTRLFPYLPTANFKQSDLVDLARVMTAPEEPGQEEKDDPEENKGIPAAYTYLGQFVDHDLTFDPISHLRETLTPAQLQALVDFRTPRFDLDNLY